MGKLIRTRTEYSDLHHRILKNKKRKIIKHEKQKNQLKRKSSNTSEEEPPSKISKISTDVKTTETFKAANFETIPENKDITDVVLVENTEFLYLKMKDIQVNDLFYNDELKNSYVQYIYKDLYSLITEEIGFEGLDGITLEAFWKRLLDAVERPITFSDTLKETIWGLICGNNTFSFYELPKPRGELQILNRYHYFDKRGTIIDVSESIPDIYPIAMVQHPTLRGSCSTLEERVDVSDKVKLMKLKEVEKEYGNKLVVVANQAYRNTLLYGDTDPVIEIPTIEYCMLERIGRSRKFGELTQGTMSTTVIFNLDARSSFHYNKHLAQNHFITKQRFFIRSLAVDQHKCGRLVHLRKFYKKIKPKQLLIVEQIVNILKRQPGFRIPATELRKYFQYYDPILKVFKMRECRNYIKNDAIYPYRTLYPNATKKEYGRKNGRGEKSIRCYELVDPNINVAACWCSNNAEDSDEEDDEDDTEVTTGNKIYNMELFRETYFHILHKGKEGLSLQDLRRLISVDTNQLRMVIKKLLSKNVVFIKKCDVGRQRQLLYYAKCLDNPDINVNNTAPVVEEIPEKKISKFRANLIQRQKAALEKRKNSSAEIKELQNTQQSFDIAFLKSFVSDVIPCPNIVIDYFVKKHVEQEDSPSENYDISIKLPRGFVIPLLFPPIQNPTFEINTHLRNINLTNETIVIKSFGEYYTAFKDFDKTVKIILLKLHFGEITMKEFRSSLNFKVKPLENVFEDIKTNEDKFKKKNPDLNYMGEDPQVVFESVEQNVETKIIVSTAPVELNYSDKYPQKIEFTSRVLSRLQLILDLINRVKVFEEINKLLKYITDEETRLGNEQKIDRRSVARLLTRLVVEGYLKIYQLILSDSKTTKSVTFICHPTVTHTDSVFEFTSQQIKWKYFPVGAPEPVKPISSFKSDPSEISPFKVVDVVESVEKLKELNQPGLKLNIKVLKEVGKTCSLKPKFVRMRIVHEFLFFLIYEYCTPREPLSHPEVRELFKSYMINISEDDLKSLPPIYWKEISWKMFIPSLPKHQGWDDGWALMCDVILRLPISVLCKIHNCSYKLPELEAILSHPVKRFVLTKDLSPIIRAVIFHQRKYLFSIYQSLDRLAFCGLLQYGPHRYKKKDERFIYLNRRASLLDTTTSEPSYYTVTEKEYKQLDFHFDSLSDVDSYWYKVHVISLNTKLNQKQTGQIVTLIDISARPELQAALAAKKCQEAIESDNGQIFGDKRGAAGWDSSLWAHITKNWFWPTSKKKQDKSTAFLGLKKEKMEKAFTHKISFSDLHQNTFGKVYLCKNMKTVKSAKGMMGSHPIRPTRSFQKIIRRIKPQHNTKRVCRDNLDKIIIKRMGISNRVKFTKHEDSCLLLCELASSLLNPIYIRRRTIVYTVIRDVMHRVCPDSLNKTSRACQRRIKNLLKENLWLEENVPKLLKIDKIAKYFSPLIGQLENRSTKDEDRRYSENELNIAFIYLMSYIFEHQEEVKAVVHGKTTIDHLSVTNLPYTENNLIEVRESPFKYSDPTSEDDVKKDVLKTVIHSSLLAQSQPETTVQLFKIYQKYPDNLIRGAVEDMKTTQTIAIKRFLMKKHQIFWQMPFKLSQNYTYNRFSTFNTKTALQSYKTFIQVYKNLCMTMDFSRHAVEARRYGQLLAINEIFTYWTDMTLNFCVPQSTVILNPLIKDHSELINELAIRFQQKLKNTLQDNASEAEQVQENEGEVYSQNDAEITTLEESKTASQESTELEHEVIDLEALQDAPLDLSIDRLKIWINDCMEERRERSPSPQFFKIKEEIDETQNTTDDMEIRQENFENRLDTSKSQSKLYSQSQIPTLEEIKEEMLKEPANINEEKVVPYITELSELLNKENSAESTVDDTTLEQLKNHFITQYPQLEGLTINNLDEFQSCFMVEYIDNQSRYTEIWKNIKDDICLKDVWLLDKVYDVIKQEGGTDDDCELTNAIIECIRLKGVMGASGPDIMEYFSNFEKNVALAYIVQILIEAKILLKTGLCKPVFIHYDFRTSWLLETFEPSLDADKLFKDKTRNEDTMKLLEDQQFIYIKLKPWVKINGSLNEEELKMWLSSVLSHCLEHPKISFYKLCEQFCYLKPMDILYLLEILQHLSCVDLCVYKTVNHSLFSEWEPPQKRHATVLDDANTVIIETNSIAMSCLGVFFNMLHI